MRGSTGRPMRAAVVLAAAALSLVAAGCGGGGGGTPTPAGRTHTSGPQRTTTAPVSRTPSPTVAVTSASPPASPTAVADPRSVDVHSLLRPGARVLKVLYGDVDGDGVDDIVVASAAAHPPAGALMAQSYLDVFRYDGHGGWPKAWEATEPAPPGNPDAPSSVLTEPDPASVNQQIDFLSLLDMERDGSSQLVVGILTVGAGPGPLDVWVIGFGPEGAVNDFSESTTSDGTLVAAGHRLKLQTPDFGPSDPACCPSRIEHQTIGFDPAASKVRVLHQSFTPVS